MAQLRLRSYRVPDNIPVNAKYPAAQAQQSAYFWCTFIAAFDECVELIAMHGMNVSDMKDMRSSMMVWIEDPRPIQDRDTLCQMCGLKKFLKIFRWTQLDLLKRILIVVSGCVASGIDLPSGWNYWFVQQYLEDSLDSQGDKRRGSWQQDGLFEHYREIDIPSCGEM